MKALLLCVGGLAHVDRDHSVKRSWPDSKLSESDEEDLRLSLRIGAVNHFAGGPEERDSTRIAQTGCCTATIHT